MVDLCNEYFEAVYTKYEEDEEGAEMQFSCLDILVLMMEEYIYGPFYEYVSPIQELQIMEIFCSYFQEKPLDPIRYFVFDCLFGLPVENLEIQKGLMVCKLLFIRGYFRMCHRPFAYHLILCKRNSNSGNGHVLNFYLHL